MVINLYLVPSCGRDAVTRGKKNPKHSTSRICEKYYSLKHCVSESDGLPNADYQKVCINAWEEAGCDFTLVQLGICEPKTVVSYWIVSNYSY